MIDSVLQVAWFLFLFMFPGAALLLFIQAKYWKIGAGNLEFILYSAGLGISYIIFAGNILNNTIGLNFPSLLLTLALPLLVFANEGARSELKERVKKFKSSLNKGLAIPLTIIFFTIIFRFDIFIHKSLYSKDPWAWFMHVNKNVFVGGGVSDILQNSIFRLDKILVNKSLYGFFSLQSFKFLAKFWYFPFDNVYLIPKLIYPIIASILVALAIYTISYRLFKHKIYATFSSFLAISSAFVIDRQSLFHPETFGVFLMLLAVLLFVSDLEKKSLLMGLFLLAALLLHLSETVFLSAVLLGFFGLKFIAKPNRAALKNLAFPASMLLMVPLFTFPEILTSAQTAITDPGFDWSFLVNFLMYGAFSPAIFALALPAIVAGFYKRNTGISLISLAAATSLFFSVLPEGILPMFPYRYIIYFVPFAAILIPSFIGGFVRKVHPGKTAGVIFAVLIVLLLLPQTFFWYINAIRTEPKFTKIAINPRYSDEAVDLFQAIKDGKKYAADKNIYVSYFYKWIGWYAEPEHNITYIERFKDRYCPDAECLNHIDVNSIREVLNAMRNNGTTLLITESMAVWSRPQESGGSAIGPLYALAEQLEPYGIFSEVERIDTNWKTPERQIVIYKVNLTAVNNYLEAFE